MFQQPQKCGGAKLHKGRQPDWCFAEPDRRERIQTCYTTFAHILTILLFPIIYFIAGYSKNSFCPNLQPLAYRDVRQREIIIYGIIAENIGPHGPDLPLLFSYRMQKYTVMPDVSAGKSNGSRLRWVKILWGNSLPETGGFCR